MTPLIEVGCHGGRTGWQISPLRVMWIKGDGGACKCMPHRQLYTQTKERDVFGFHKLCDGG